MDFQWTSTGVHWSSLESTGIRGAEESIGFLLDFWNIIFVFTVATHKIFKKRSAMKFRMGNPDIILAVPLDRGRL